MYRCRRIGYDPNVVERPNTGGSSVRPRWKQGVPQCGNQTTSTRASIRIKSNSESVNTNRRACGKNNTGASVWLRIGVPGAWHSQETAHRPATHRFQRCAGLAVCKPEIPNPAVQCRGIPPAFRRRRMSSTQGQPHLKVPPSHAADYDIDEIFDYNYDRRFAAREK